MSTPQCTAGGKDSYPSNWTGDCEISPVPPMEYRLYKRRFSGLLGFVSIIMSQLLARLVSTSYHFPQIILGLVTGMQWSWFGPITNNGECVFQLLSCFLVLFLLLMTILSYPVADDFHISVTQVNWLGNIMSCIYVPASIFILVICSRYGIRRCVRCLVCLPPSILQLFPHIDRCGRGHVTRFRMGALRGHNQLVIPTVRVCPPHSWPGLLSFPTFAHVLSSVYCSSLLGSHSRCSKCWGRYTLRSGSI